MIDIPLFITPMMKAPITAPITFPTPAGSRSATNKNSSDNVKLETDTGFGSGRIQTRSKNQAGERGQDAHRHEGTERQSLRLDAGEFGCLFIAAQRIDTSADRRARRNEGKERDQNAHDNQDVWQTFVGRKLITQIKDKPGNNYILQDKKRKGAALETMLLTIQSPSETVIEHHDRHQRANRHRGDAETCLAG